MNRRTFLGGGLAAGAALALPTPASTQHVRFVLGRATPSGAIAWQGSVDGVNWRALAKAGELYNGTGFRCAPTFLYQFTVSER